MIAPSYANATVLPMAITASEAQGGGVTKLIRVTLTEDQWRRLRVKAAEEDVSMTRLLGAILAGEADKRGRGDG